MKHLLILLITISIGAFAQETNSEWDYDEEGYNEEVKASLNFINAERVDDLLIKKKRRSFLYFLYDKIRQKWVLLLLIFKHRFMTEVGNNG